MTVAEMIIGVQLGVQKVGSNSFDNIIDEEILYYLNKANREYIRRQTVYLKKDIKDNRADYISDIEVFNNLRTMIISHSFSTLPGGGLGTSTSAYKNGQTVDLSVLEIPLFDYVYATAITANENVPCKMISPNQIYMYTKTNYNDNIFRQYPIFFMGDVLIVLYDSERGACDSLFLNYIKQPNTLVKDTPGIGEVSTSELPFHTHDDIVDIAVAIIMEDLKSARPYEQNQATIKGEKA